MVPRRTVSFRAKTRSVAMKDCCRRSCLRSGERSDGAHMERPALACRPSAAQRLLEDWLDLGSEKPLVFLRSSFAHLYFWYEGAVYSLEVHRGSVSRVTPKIGFMFTLLCDPEIQEKILRSSLHEQMLPRIGPPARDECYAFEPALALGGPGTPDTIRRVKIREHLAILAQLVR